MSLMKDAALWTRGLRLLVNELRDAFGGVTVTYNNGEAEVTMFVPLGK